MILMAVREDDPGQPFLLILDELEIREDQFNAGIAGIGEGQAEIDHDPLAAAAVEIDVHADLARAAERYEQQFFSRYHFQPRVVMLYSKLKPWIVRSGSIASNTFVCLSNRVARPPVATTVIGRPSSRLIRPARPSSIAT